MNEEHTTLPQRGRPGLPQRGRAGTLLADRYQLGPLLGQGGMADVYRAVDTATGEAVAVKLLRAPDPAAARRLAQEAKALGRLRHDGLVQLRDAGVGTGDGQAYLVMDLVEGQTLAGVLRGGPLGSVRTAAIAATVGHALAYVHAHGIVHRDVKPGNVLVDTGGRPHLADFGIASLADASVLTVTGTTLGTAAYMAPEQLEHHQVGPAADVWSLAMVLLECLLGRRVYQGSPAEVVARRLAGPVPLPIDLPVPWRLLLAGMFDHDPSRRPSAAEAAAMVEGPAFAAPWIPTPAAARPGDASAEPTAVAGHDVAALAPTDATAVAVAGHDPTALAPTDATAVAGHDFATLSGVDPGRFKLDASADAIPAPARLKRWLPWLAALAAVVVVAVATTVFGSSPARRSTSGSATHKAAAAPKSTTTSTTTTAPPSTASAATALLGAIGGDAAAGALTAGEAATLGRDVSAALVDVADGSTASAASDLAGAEVVVATAVGAGSLSAAQAATLRSDLSTLAAAAGLPAPTPPTATAPPTTATAPPTAVVPSGPGPGGGNGNGHGKRH